MASQLQREMTFNGIASRLEALDERLRRRMERLKYPEWFMMPTNEGARFLIATFLLGLASANTGNNLIYVIFGLMLSIVVLSYALVSINIRRVSVSVLPGEPIHAREDGHVTLRITNHKRVASYSLKVRLPDEFSSSGFVPYVGAGQSIKIGVKVSPLSRGVFGYGSFTVESGFPFIFFRRRRSVEVLGEMLVYPALTKVSASSLRGGDGEGRQRQSAGGGEDLFSLREFRAGDDRKAVHWKASARADALVVKEFTSPVPRVATIVFDTSGPSNPEAFESLVSRVAYLVQLYLQGGYYLSFLSQSMETGMGSGKEQYYKIMDVLATIKETDVLRCPQPDEADALILAMKSTGSACSVLVSEAAMVLYADTV